MRGAPSSRATEGFDKSNSLRVQIMFVFLDMRENKVRIIELWPDQGMG